VWRVRTLVGALLVAAGIAVAAPAGADPADLVPYCTGSQTPMDSNCRAAPSQGAVEPQSGLSPDLPFGLNPGGVPAI
jgi:hypothetical protein